MIFGHVEVKLFPPDLASLTSARGGRTRPLVAAPAKRLSLDAFLIVPAGLRSQPYEP